MPYPVSGILAAMRGVILAMVVMCGCGDKKDGVVVPVDAASDSGPVEGEAGAAGPDAPTEGDIFLKDITHLLATGPLDTRGAALVDFDADSWPDVLLAGTDGLHMWRNSGDGTFEDYTEESGLYFTDGPSSIGVVFGDVEGDGDLDLFVSRVEAPDVLLLAEDDGGGVFYEDSTAASGINGVTFSQGASFGDLDGDGDLDIYVAIVGRPIDGPNPAPGLRGAPNIFWRNDGQGHFEDATVEAGLGGNPLGETFQSVLFDADGDNDLDVFTVHDFEVDQLLLNDGTGHFTDGGKNWIPHIGSGLMGLDLGDLDSDGDLDIYGSNWGVDHVYTFDPAKPGFDEVMSDFLGDGFDPSSALTGWGVALNDLDNDGDPDVITTAAFSDGTDGQADTVVVREGAMTVWENRGPNGKPGALVDITEVAGDAFGVPLHGFGLAVGDIDKDGDLDVIVGVDRVIDSPINSQVVRRTPLLLRNDSKRTATNRSLMVRLKQPGTLNLFAVGARVDVTAPSVRASRVLLAGSSFMSCNTYAMHFGLGTNQAATVTVTWPDGETTVRKDVPAGEVLITR